MRLKCDDTRAETRSRLSAKRTSPFTSAGASVQSSTDSRGVRMSGSNVGYNMLRGSVKSTGYPFHSPVLLHFPSRAPPCAITFQLESNYRIAAKLCTLYTWFVSGTPCTSSGGGGGGGGDEIQNWLVWHSNWQLNGLLSTRGKRINVCCQMSTRTVWLRKMRITQFGVTGK